MNNFSSLPFVRFSLILSQLDLDVASLSPVYAFNSKLKIIHHSILDFIIDLFLNERSERNDNEKRNQKIIRFVCFSRILDFSDKLCIIINT